MKTIIFLAASLLTTAAIAQAPLHQGAINYDMTIALRKEVAKKSPVLARLVPEQQHLQLTLTFRDYEFSVKTEEPKAAAPASGSQARVTVKTDDNSTQFVNLRTGTIRELYVINKRNYYVEKPVGKSPAVKFFNETRKILGYTCHKAVVTDKQTVYTVWYTKDLPFSYSPQLYLFSNIKGAVLEYATPTMVCRATAIGAKGFLEKNLVLNPSAKKVTAEQLEDLQDNELTAASTKGAAGSPEANRKVITQTITIGE